MVTRAKEERRALKLAIIAALVLLIVFSVTAKAQTVVTGAGSSTASQVISLFTGCSGIQYLGADGACHSGGGGFVAPGQWGATGGVWTAGTDAFTQTITRTSTASGALTTSFVYNETLNGTTVAGTDVNFRRENINLSGPASLTNGANTWAGHYIGNDDTVSGASSVLAHALLDVIRLTMHTASTTTVNLAATLYPTIGGTAINGQIDNFGLASLSFDPISGTTGNIGLIFGASIGAPPNVTGGMTAPSVGGLVISDYLGNTAASICEVCVGGTPPSLKAPIFVATPSAVPTASVYIQSNGGTGGGESVIGGGFGTFRAFKAFGAAGSPPTCTFTSGGGTSPSCSLGGGSTDSIGVIVLTTGSGSPASSGTATLTFSATFGSNNPVCHFSPSLGGAGQWNARASIFEKTPSTSSELFQWDNNAVALGASTAFWLEYVCVAK